METPHFPALAGLLTARMDLRKAKCQGPSGFGKQKGAADDLKAAAKAMMYLNSKGLVTPEDLDSALQGPDAHQRRDEKSRAAYTDD